MSDIFISYSREDLSAAELLAEALAEEGWSVWWDRSIPAGRSYDQVLEEEIDGANCILVLWSASSINSEWVRVEAGEGARRDILVPVILEAGVRIPLEFRRIQTADLSSWHGDSHDQSFLTVVQAIQGKISLARTEGDSSTRGESLRASSPSSERVRSRPKWRAMVRDSDHTGIHELEVHLTHESHIVTFQMDSRGVRHLFSQLSVDNEVVVDLRSDSPISGYLSFILSDGRNLLPARLTFKERAEDTAFGGAFVEITEIRLTVADRVVYEGE